MADNDRYKLSIVGRFGTSQQFVCGLHYRQIGASTLPGAQALAEAFHSLHGSTFRALISSSYIVDAYEVRQVNAPATEGYDEPDGLGGGVAGEPIPPMDCVLVAWLTGLIGRRYRGRTYFPAPTEGEQGAGTLTATPIANYNAFASDILLVPAQDASAAEFQLVVWHDDLGTSTDVVNGVTRNLLATQRRRRSGVGS